MELVIPAQTKLCINGLDVVTQENLHCEVEAKDYDHLAELVVGAKIPVDMSYEENGYKYYYGAGGRKFVMELPVNVEEKPKGKKKK